MKKEKKQENHFDGLASDIHGILSGSVFKIKLDELSDLALDINGTKTEYSDEDLSNAMLVFVEVLFNKEFDKHSDKLSQEGMGALATLTGSTLRDLVKEWTGVDLHEVYKK